MRSVVDRDGCGQRIVSNSSDQIQRARRLKRQLALAAPRTLSLSWPVAQQRMPELQYSDKIKMHDGPSTRDATRCYCTVSSLDPTGGPSLSHTPNDQPSRYPFIRSKSAEHAGLSFRVCVYCNHGKPVKVKIASGNKSDESLANGSRDPIGPVRFQTLTLFLTGKKGLGRSKDKDVQRATTHSPRQPQAAKYRTV